MRRFDDKPKYRSAWTPLNDHRSNRKIFDERRGLLASWFSKWSSVQRKRIMLDLLPMCDQKQLLVLDKYLKEKLPNFQVDFTRTLPRVLSIYIFSFLDPRSLCRCAQVCWYWNHLAESNEIWAHKCLLRGWKLTDSQEPGIWKKFYVQNIRYLQRIGPQTKLAKEMLNEINQIRLINQPLEPDYQQFETFDEDEPTRVRRFSLSCTKSSPWHGPDKNPDEIYRTRLFAADVSDSEGGTTVRQRCNSIGRFQIPTAKHYSPNDAAATDLTRTENLRKPKERSKSLRPNSKIIGTQIAWKPSSVKPTQLSGSHSSPVAVLQPVPSMSKPVTYSKSYSSTESSHSPDSVQETSWSPTDLSEVVQPSGEYRLTTKINKGLNRKQMTEKSPAPQGLQDIRDQNVFSTVPNKCFNSPRGNLHYKVTQGDIQTKDCSDQLVHSTECDFAVAASRPCAPRPKPRKHVPSTMPLKFVEPMTEVCSNADVNEYSPQSSVSHTQEDLSVDYELISLRSVHPSSTWSVSH